MHDDKFVIRWGGGSVTIRSAHETGRWNWRAPTFVCFIHSPILIYWSTQLAGSRSVLPPPPLSDSSLERTHVAVSAGSQISASVTRRDDLWNSLAATLFFQHCPKDRCDEGRCVCAGRAAIGRERERHFSVRIHQETEAVTRGTADGVRASCPAPAKGSP
jgi:hypothetical protein